MRGKVIFGLLAALASGCVTIQEAAPAAPSGGADSGTVDAAIDATSPGTETGIVDAGADATTLGTDTGSGGGDGPVGDIDTGIASDGGQSDSEGTPIALVSGLTLPCGIAVDATSVYWTDGVDGTVMKVPVNGGVTKVLASQQDHPCGVAVDATSVYWLNRTRGDGMPMSGGVLKISLDGGMPITLASGQDLPLAIAVDSTSVYWSNAGTNAGTGALMKVPLGGGVPPSTLTPGVSVTVSAIAVDGTGLYWTGGSVVMKIPLDGTTTLGQCRDCILAAEQSSAYALAVNATNVSWTDLGNGASIIGTGTVMTVPSDGGTPVTLASGQIQPLAMTVDATSAYWVTGGGTGNGCGGPCGTVMKVPLGGGTPIMLASGQDAPQAMAVDANSIYWIAGAIGATTPDGGMLMKLTPK